MFKQTFYHVWRCKGINRKLINKAYYYEHTNCHCHPLGN